MLKSVRYEIGHWTFVPSAHELRSGTARVRLQRRASTTLSLLCERAGEVVTRQEIIDRGWGRQHLSPNSVAIVIGDLRRAIGIGTGEPGSIETVPKAGYRLIGSSELAEPAPKGRSRLPVLATIVITILVVLGLAFAAIRPGKPEIALAGIENATGTGQYAPLMQACSETVLLELGRHSDQFNVLENPVKPNADYVLQQRWVLWSGAPELVLVARDRSGQTVWSGAIYGNENQFPAKISDKIGQFAAFARTSGERS